MYKLNWGKVNEINRKFELIISFSLCNFAMVSVIVDRQGKKKVVYIYYIWWNHVTWLLLSFNNQSINLFGCSVFKKITVNDITWSWNNHVILSGSNLLCQFRNFKLHITVAMKSIRLLFNLCLSSDEETYKDN